MIDEKKQYTVTIGDYTYTLTSDETEDHIAYVAQRVNDLIDTFQEKKGWVDPTKKAAMAAFTLANCVIKLEKQHVDMCHSLDTLMQLCDQLTERPN